MLEKSRTYAASFRLDAATQDRLAWLLAAVSHLMPGTKVSHSVLMRRALAVYVDHMEKILGTKGEVRPGLLRSEGYELNHHRNEHRSSFPGGKLHEPAMYIGEVFQPYSKLVKAAIKNGPSALEKLERDFPASSFRRRAD